MMPDPKLTIRVYGDTCLRTKAKPVSEVGVSERILIEAMIKAMHEYKGIGLAAPQVGVSQQIFVADIGLGPVVVINPKVLKRDGSESMEEGCLSIPDVIIPIKRPQHISVKYIDENNQAVEKDYYDLMARVFLHEMDHLFGKLIVDYAGWREKFRLNKKLQEIAKEKQITSCSSNLY